MRRIRYDPNQPRDRRGRWTQTIEDVYGSLKGLGYSLTTDEVAKKVGVSKAVARRALDQLHQEKRIRQKVLQKQKPADWHKYGNIQVTTGPKFFAWESYD